MEGPPSKKAKKAPRATPAKLTFTDISAQVRCTAETLSSTLQRLGVAIVPLCTPADALAFLLETAPLQSYNRVLQTPIGASTEELYGLRDLTSKISFPNMASGMVNCYTAVQPFTWDTMHQAMATLYPNTNARMFPNRFRCQLPTIPLEENSHIDGWCKEMYDVPVFSTILALSNGRPFEFVGESHTPAFRDMLRENKYGPENYCAFANFHLENPDTPDPMNLNSKWCRVVAGAGELIVFNTALLHRVAPVTGKRAIWSMFVSVEPERKDYDNPKGPLAVVKPTLNDRTFRAPYLRPGMTDRECRLYALLRNYQTNMWPSGKRTFYYMDQALGALTKTFKPEYMKDVPESMQKEGQALSRRPVWPAGVGCHVDSTRIDPVQLARLIIPVAAMEERFWTFDPTRLDDRTLRMLGFLNY